MKHIGSGATQIGDNAIKTFPLSHGRRFMNHARLGTTHYIFALMDGECAKSTLQNSHD